MPDIDAALDKVISTENNVTLEVGGVEFSGWENISITRALDTCADGFSMGGPFDPSQPVASSFKPFSYKNAVVKIDGERILTGRIEMVNAEEGVNDRTISVQGRSLPGSLVDSSIDIGRLQFDKLKLSQIAKPICQPHGIMVLAKDDTKAIKEARAEPGQTGFEFLNKLAQDYGLLLTCDTNGLLVITKIALGAAPVASLVVGQGGVISVSGAYNGSARFSRYKVLQQQDGAPAITGKADDAGVPIYRPKVEAGGENDASDVTTAAKWRRALALSEAVSVSAEVSGWRTEQGKLWAPGQVVTLKAPGAYIAKETAFIIASVTLTIDASNGRMASLRLVLPATYSGEMPGVYPWD